MTSQVAAAAAIGKPEHAGAEEFAQLIRAVTKDPGYVHHCLRHRREFVARYPDLTEWSAAVSYTHLTLPTSDLV